MNIFFTQNFTPTTGYKVSVYLNRCSPVVAVVAAGWQKMTDMKKMTDKN